ncbi:MAG: hypothetical protein K0R51_3545 [Cytophagaceae bacterium]|jgi:uncharacterized membrane protein|nr:hypothetical protein [Cytophagaceae bacterium]
MKKYLLAAFILLSCLSSYPLQACTSCNKELNTGIYNDFFYENLFIILSPFFVIAAIVIVLSILSTKQYNKLSASNLNINPIPLTTAAAVLGIGMGGFIDGIVFHQILQWHEMLSNKISTTDYIGKSINMYWDGIFHAFCLVVVFTGVILLWKLISIENINRSGKLLAGGLLAGWGLFNTVEGLLNHHLLKLHNVQEASFHHETANLIFLGFSVVLLIVGYACFRTGHKNYSVNND